MPACEVCGERVVETYTLALEWPAESSEDRDDSPPLDDPGAGVLALCGDCASAVATDVLVDRAVRRGLDDVYAGLAGDGPGEVPAPSATAQGGRR